MSIRVKKPIDKLHSEKIVYYPEIGYLNPHLWQAPKLTNWVDKQLKTRHLPNLKLLALYFHHILLPTSHLLAPVGHPDKVLKRKFLTHPGVRCLIERNIIISTLWRQASGSKEFIERYTQFLTNSQWGFDPLDNEDCLKSILNIDFYSRDVTEQSQFTGEEIQDTLSKQKSTLTTSLIEENEFSLLVDLIKEFSQGGEVSFAHEPFFYNLQLSDNFSKETKKIIITTTNDIYFESGELGNPGVVVYQDFTGGMRRSLSTGIPALLYSPQIFEEFLSIFLSKDDLSTLKSLPSERIYGIRSKDSWEPFLERYHRLLTRMTIESVSELDTQAGLREVMRGKVDNIRGKSVLSWVTGLLPLLTENPLTSSLIKNSVEPLVIKVIQYSKEPSVQRFIYDLKKEIYKHKR